MIQRIHNQQAVNESDAVISYPVDETRRSLLSLIQENQEDDSRPSSKQASRPTIQRSKSSSVETTRMLPTKPRRVQRSKSIEVDLF